MGKKVTKAPARNLRRTRSMEQCVEDAQDFLKPRGRKITKTKTMVRTIEEARKKVTPKKVAKPKVFKKAVKRRVKPVISRPAVPSKPAVAMPPPPIASMSMPPVKKTAFKTSSRDNLPLPAFGFIDICFCLDATGSMSSELAAAQTTIKSIIEKISNKVMTEGITLRFGVVAYRDHMDRDILQVQDFTDADEAIKFTNKLYASGGGDEPEAAHDGIMTACKKLKWMQIAGTPMLRYIFHVLDAPPHGKEFGTSQSQEGCTCGIKTDEIIHEMNLRQIHYRMIKVRANPRVDICENIFKNKLGNFDSADIAHASEMNIRVSDMVIHEVMPE